jgi:PAS domain S-box-containing protein
MGFFRSSHAVESIAFPRFLAHGDGRDADWPKSGCWLPRNELMTALKKQTPRSSRVLDSEHRFREMADHAPVMIWISGQDKLCTWFNKPWLQFTGRSMEEELGNGWSEGVHPQDFDRCLETYVTTFDLRRPFTMEYRLRRHDGEWRWLLDNGSPLYDNNGIFSGYIGSCIDITDRKQSEELLRESESRLRNEAQALASLNDASSRLWHLQSLHEGLSEILAATIELLGADMGNIQLLNPEKGVLYIAAQRGFQQDFLEFFREVSTEDDSACGRALRSNARALIEDVNSDPPYAPLRAIASAAGYRAVQSTPLVDRLGKPLGILSTHWRASHRPDEQDLRRLDLYARQAADFISRCKTDDTLRDNESRIRAILNTATDAIITIDQLGTIVAINPSTERLFGYKTDELIGQNIRLLMPSPFRDEHDGFLRKYLETGKARIIGTGREVVGLRKDGSTFPVDLAVSEVEHLGLFTAIVRDISARRQTEMVLDQYRRDLRTMSSELVLAEERERQRLAQDLHDGLGQALFRLNMKVAEGVTRGDPNSTEIRSILDEVGRMVNTLTFELSPPILRQLGLRAALKWLSRDMHQRYGLSVHIDDDGHEISIEERVSLLLFRSLRELLINVAKHAETDIADLSIQKLEDSVRFQIQDGGKGFDPLDPSHGVDGGHFGLFSIRERLEYLGGSFEIRSAVGEGTSVTLTVPATNQQGPDSRCKS